MVGLFGTDGVRGRANDLLTPELAVALARATASMHIPPGGHVIIGRDTRVSGPMLEAALASGFASSGVHVSLAGVIPTPAISFLIKDERADLGAVISASHNPPEDNGVKFFDRTGRKLSVEAENAIEDTMQRSIARATTVGTVRPLDAAATRYAAFLTGAIESDPIDLTGTSLVVDCAHGATSEIAPHVLRHLGATVIELNRSHDGMRINVGCGSTDLRAVQAAVRERGAELGVAFDGDGDRVLLVDAAGRVIDGDQMMGIAAQHMAEDGTLVPRVVVATIMTNAGLGNWLDQRGIELVRTDVGDRHVARTMDRLDARLGGEQSGHIIFRDHSPTGDGILTTVKLLEVAHAAGQSVGSLAVDIPLYPQTHRKIPCADPSAVSGPQVQAVVEAAREQLGRRGRVIVRPSGTQPIVRVTVEAEDESACVQTADALARQIEPLLKQS